MALCLDYFEDEIFENQRRLQVVPAGIAPLDTQYKKIHLNSATDPSGWVDNEWKTVSPATKQPKEGHVYLEPWVYVINPPYTDEAGWIYKKQFSSPEEFPSNGVLTMVRTRKWKRKSVPVEQKAAALDIAERGQEESNRYNAFNLAFINKLFNAGTAAAEKFEYSLQIVCENRRLSSSMLSHDNRMEVFEDKVDTKKLMDPPIWTLYDIPKYMPHKYRKPHSTLNETTMRYVIATTSSLRIPFEGDVNATIAKLNTNSPAWDGAETPRSLSPDNAAPQSQQSMSYLNRPRRASLHKKLTSHATTPPLEVETKDWVALCGWNFFIDFATDDAGWEYSDSFYAKDSEGNTINQVNTDQWDRRYNNLLNVSHNTK